MLAAALVADTVAWTLACSRIEEGIGEAFAEAASIGWTLSHGTPSRAGWPLAAEVVLPDVVAAAGPEAVPRGFVWRAPALRVRLGLLRPTTLLLSPRGQQRLAATGLASIPIEAATAELAVPLNGGPPVATVADLAATLPAGRLTVRRADLTFPPDALEATLAGIALPGAALQVDALLVQARLTRPVPPGLDPAERARAWRASGGRLELPRATLRSGPLEASGQGALTLDEHLQPRADGSVAATGIASALDALARTGALSPAAAAAAKAVVAILAAPAPGAPVRLPVQLADGVVTVAGFPLLRVPPLAWE